jgi:hypothetical protein
MITSLRGQKRSINFQNRVFKKVSKKSKPIIKLPCSKGQTPFAPGSEHVSLILTGKATGKALLFQ